MRALLYSGGLDSSCAWWILGKPRAFYCGGLYGPARNANLGEMLALERQRAISLEFAAALVRVEVDFRPFMRAGQWNMGRDQLIAAAAWAEGFDGVSLAWCGEDGTSADTRMSAAASIKAVVRYPFDVEFPLAHMSKPELVRAALSSGAPLTFLLASHSCVTRSDKHCGTCTNCEMRERALAGVA